MSNLLETFDMKIETVDEGIVGSYDTSMEY